MLPVLLAAWSLAAAASGARQPMATHDPDLGISEGLARERSASILL